ncbi:uncharacterized protein LOC115633871 isoform X2 [Scaptodrosophila lebanonensis]|uniref:Uncharacterized protein LOC115633871 isoform X2 n=1 Tax=Drosophila lebanonensis TaxID=7225 RepID=A0A6J2UGI5_DROLE|nr:uncharacterized protein LOC115633871 isoform X2 [Scaptodrosophila lebanonensis]
MVLTNFECWAHGDGDAAAANNFETGPLRSAPIDMFNPRAVSQISSNGYYGYAFVNGDDANNNNINNNNITTDNIHGMQEIGVGATARCKKRCYVDGGAGATAAMDFFEDASSVGQPVSAKRCRFDDGDLAAQYFNDFFSMPATQIGTQACLMDYDDMQAAGDATEAQAPHVIQQQHLQPTIQHPRINQHYQGHLHRANRDNPDNNNNHIKPNYQMP